MDESVDSLALEDYDYYEDVTKKRWTLFYFLYLLYLQNKHKHNDYY